MSAAMAQGGAAGLASVKERMIEMSKELKICKERERVALEGSEKADARFKNCFGKMHQMQLEIAQKEEKLRKNEEKLKYKLDRINEKETHLQNLEYFNSSLTQVAPEVLLEYENKIKRAKEQYMKTKLKYAGVKEKAQNLEEDCERKEYKAREAERRYDMLRVQYEFTCQEWESTSRRCNAQLSVSDTVEHDYERTRNNLIKARERQERASKMLMALESRIAKTEAAIDDYKRRRKSMESTLRELMSTYQSSKNSEESAYATKAFYSQQIKSNTAN